MTIKDLGMANIQDLCKFRGIDARYNLNYLTWKLSKGDRTLEIGESQDIHFLIEFFEQCAVDKHTLGYRVGNIIRVFKLTRVYENARILKTVNLDSVEVEIQDISQDSKTDQVLIRIRDLSGSNSNRRKLNRKTDSTYEYYTEVEEAKKRRKEIIVERLAQAEKDYENAKVDLESYFSRKVLLVKTYEEAIKTYKKIIDSW